MATTSLCDDLPPSLEKEDLNLSNCSLENLITSTWDRADIVLQGLKESQSELLSHVKKLKEDWQADMDRQMNSCEQEIEGLSNAHNAEMERLQIVRASEPRKCLERAVVDAATELAARSWGSRWPSVSVSETLILANPTTNSKLFS
ncbi:uncharacterized protein [Physcomitrium patens]|uniref:uncharacterized protein isoform X1 n=1 Tax=Physcomitrium patens TaxID=3218 RepID=UPI000D16CA21|nr:uncharacterized protein LOC112285157 isoform X1 [Physcomitrium patens]|eukprot:XP_024381520.1 uncharacterized protein LOC112285157 isoform X1 [Physcomitrella patens]